MTTRDQIDLKKGTFTLFLHLFGFLEPFQQASEISDAVRKRDLLVFVGSGVFQNLPHVHLRSFLLLDFPDATERWHSMRSEVIGEVHSTCDEEPDYLNMKMEVVLGSSRHVAQRDGQKLCLYAIGEMLQEFYHWVWQGGLNRMIVGRDLLCLWMDCWKLVIMRAVNPFQILSKWDQMCEFIKLLHIYI